VKSQGLFGFDQPRDFIDREPFLPQSAGQHMAQITIVPDKQNPHG
jgi:hypothetical protein